MARRNDHTREELQEMALNAAEKLLDEQGSSALSARKVASAIGYSVGSLYLVFKNLDDLCWQVNARTLNGLLNELDARDTLLSAEGRLKGYAHGYLEYAQAWPHRWSLLFEHRSPDGTDAPEWLHQSIAALFGRIEQALVELKPNQPEEEITVAARTLWSGVHGITLLKLRDKLFLGDDSEPKIMIDGLVERYIAGWNSYQGGEK